MERTEKLYAVAADIIGLALNFEADTSITIADLKSAYVDAEDKFKDAAAANFDRKVGAIQKLLGTVGDTQVAAKAAAYDRVLAVADNFVRNFTQGTGHIPNEVELTKHLEESQKALADFKTIEANAKTMRLSTEQYALMLNDQVTQCVQTIQAKDAEIAQLRQQLQQKDAEISQLKAAQPVPTH